MHRDVSYSRGKLNFSVSDEGEPSNQYREREKETKRMWRNGESQLLSTEL